MPRRNSITHPWRDLSSITCEQHYEFLKEYFLHVYKVVYAYSRSEYQTTSITNYSRNDFQK